MFKFFPKKQLRLLGVTLLMILSLAVLIGCPGPRTPLRESAKPDYTPQWTPDGSRIVLANFPDGPNYEANIYAVQTDGKKLHRLTTKRVDKAYQRSYSPDVHPNGTRIVYTTRVYDTNPGPTLHTFQIATSDLDGSNPQRLTENYDLDTAPTWSPDGSRIAFAKLVGESGPTGQFLGIYTMAADGSEISEIYSARPFRSDGAYIPNPTGSAFVKKLINPEFDSAYRSGPVWSPDGKRLAFAIQEAIVELSEDREFLLRDLEYRDVLYVANTDGSNLEQVFVTPNQLEQPGGGRILGAPAWSPNGQQLWFRYGGSSSQSLHAVESDGSGLRKMSVYTSGLDHTLALSPDGKKLLYSSGWSPFKLAIDKRHPPRIDTIDANGSNPQTIALGFIYPAWSPDGSRIAAVYGRKPYKGEQVDYLITMAPDGSDLQVLARLDEDYRLKAVNEKCFLWFCR